MCPETSMFDWSFEVRVLLAWHATGSYSSRCGRCLYALGWIFGRLSGICRLYGAKKLQINSVQSFWTVLIRTPPGFSFNIPVFSLHFCSAVAKSRRLQLHGTLSFRQLNSHVRDTVGGQRQTPA